MSFAPNTISLPPLGERKRTIALYVIAGITVIAVCIPGLWFAYAALALVGLSALLYVVAATFRGRVDKLVAGWVLLFPLGYYYFSFPREHPIITLDRAFIGILLVAACIVGARGTIAIPVVIRRSAGFWGAFLFFALITIPRVKNPLNAGHLWVEAFFFPALVAFFVLRNFNVRRNLAALHVATCIMAIYVAGVGAAEVVLQRDLMAVDETGILLAGDYGKQEAGDILVRPDGPFASTDTFALVGLISFFFLLFLNRSLGQMPTWQLWLHRAGMAAAIAIALMPLFRSVLTSLAAVLLIDTYYSRGRARVTRIAVGGCLLLLLVLVRLALPAVFEERSDPMNVYGRIAQQGQTAMMFLDNPVNGVGLANFQDAAQKSGKYMVYYQGVRSVDSAHNNLGQILAETGLTGFVPYVIAQVLLFVAFFRIRKTNPPDTAIAWQMALYIMLGYFINGMSLTSGYAPALNMWFMFSLAVIYKYAATRRDQPAPAAIT